MQNAAFARSDCLRCTSRCAVAPPTCRRWFGRWRVPAKAVTSPSLTKAALGALDQGTRLADVAGACNTFWADGGAVIGDNTDVPGPARRHEALDPPDGPWLVAGTGGGARAAANRCPRARGGHRGTVAQRREAPLLRRMGPAMPAWRSRLRAEVPRPAANATPQGLQSGDPLPMTRDPSARSHCGARYDLSRGETAWVRAMRQGRPARRGRSRHVGGTGRRGIRSAGFRISALPVEVMRATVAAALR